MSTRPEASAAAEAIYALLDPAFTAGDEDRDWATLKLVQSLSIGVLDQIYDYVIDTDERPGWAIVLDPDDAPVELLPWQSQFDGAELRPDMNEQQRREAIKSPEAFLRGSIDAMVQVAKRRLTGTKTVLVTERYTGRAWRLLIETLEDETPEPAKTQAEITEEQKPIGILLFFNHRPAWTWGELLAEPAFATWAYVLAEEPTWLAVRTHEP